MAQSNRKFYRDNGTAAYDVYAWNDQAARQYDDNRAYERTLPTELPDEQVREQPYRRVKAKTTVAPFTLAGMLTVACLMILVIFGYVQLFEASSNVSRLETQLANLKEQQLMLQSKYDAKIDLTAAEEYAAEIGLTKCQPEQIVYVSFSGTDQAEIYTQQRTSVFGEILDSRVSSALSNICTPQQHKLGQNLPVGNPATQGRSLRTAPFLNRKAVSWQKRSSVCRAQRSRSRQTGSGMNARTEQFSAVP